MAASPAPGSPLDASDVQVVSGSVITYSMARDAAGDFVMVWQQVVTGASSAPINVQRFDASGKPQGSAFQVVTSDIDPADPSVAMDAAGDFVVAWDSVGAPYQQTATYDVHAQRFSAAGAPVGAESLVSTLANFDDINPSVAMDAAGDAVVVWQGEPSPGGVPEPPPAYQIYARRYSAAGTALSDQFLVSDASSNQSWPSVAMDAAGDFVAVWHTGDDHNLGYLAQDILAQRYDAAGVAQGGAFPLSTAANTGREDPQVAMAAGGGFVVAWINFFGSPTEGDIHAQQYDAKGVPQGGELLVNTFTTGDQSQPSVSMDAGGDFTVAWDSFDEAAADSDYDIYAQRYSAKGTPVGTEFLVNTLNQGPQFLPTAVMDADGDMVVAWNSRAGVYVRRFAREKNVHLSLGAAFAPAAPSPGSSFSMTLAVNNTSTTTPTGSNSVDAALDIGMGITAAITLPQDATYQSAQGTDWTCANPADANLSCSYSASLAAGSAAPPLTVLLTAPSAPGSLAFNASVTSTLTPVTSESVATSVTVQTAGNGSGSSGSGNSGSGNSGSGSSGGGNSGSGSTGSGGSGTGSNTGGKGAGTHISGKGAMDILSLAFLGLPLLGRCRSKHRSD